MAEMNTGPPLTPRGSYTLRGYGGGYLDTFLVAKEHFKEQVSNRVGFVLHWIYIKFAIIITLEALNTVKL